MNGDQKALEILKAVAQEAGATEPELFKITPAYTQVIRDMKRKGVPIGASLDESGEIIYRIGSAENDKKAREEVKTRAAETSFTSAPPDVLTAPPPSHSPAEAPATPRPEKPPVDVRPLHFLRTIRVTDFRISAGGGRTKIVATPADTASAGAALELSGLDTGVLILEISVEGESAVPTEPQPAKRERSAKEIAAEIAEQEKQGLPGSLASAMGNLLGRG